MDFPDVSRFTTQGFIEYTSRVISGGKERLRSERPTLDRIDYHAERPR